MITNAKVTILEITDLMDKYSDIPLKEMNSSHFKLKLEDGVLYSLFDNSDIVVFVDYVKGDKIIKSRWGNLGQTFA